MARGPVTPVAVTASGLIQVEGTTPLIFHGFAIRETGGGAGVVEIRDGGSSGAIIASAAFATNTSPNPLFTEAGIATAAGVYVKVVSGTISGAVFVS